jgi:serine/threonine protein kinase
MKPTPDGLKEKFIIPILREVAEAVKWVHQAGIIHRDLKCKCLFHDAVFKYDFY